MKQKLEMVLTMFARNLSWFDLHLLFDETPERIIAVNFARKVSKLDYSQGEDDFIYSILKGLPEDIQMQVLRACAEELITLDEYKDAYIWLIGVLTSK